MDKGYAKAELILLKDQIKVLQKYSQNNVAFVNIPINIYAASTTVITIGTMTAITLTNATTASIVAALIAQGYPSSLIGMRNNNATGVFNIQNTTSAPIPSCSVSITVSGVTTITDFSLNAPYLSDEQAYNLISDINVKTDDVGSSQWYDLDGSMIVH